jgi:N-acetylmuramoyl-L-alanine amidase
MAARWLGLARPTKKIARNARRGFRHAMKQSAHAIGAVGVLTMAAAMNFALYPDALAEVVGAQHAIVGFVPNETQMHASTALPDQVIEVDETEVRLLAATAWGEARSEGEAGMRAVAHVMQNRVGDRFGEDLATVILSPKQFSVWNRGDPNRRLVQSLVANPSRVPDAEWETAQRVAREVLSGQSVDPTNGALFYHTGAIRPRWSRQGEGRQVIGSHVFYTDVPDAGTRRTPRTINVAQVLTRALPTASERPARQTQRGPRAGRVNGVIQYAPAEMAGQLLPSERAAQQTDVNAAATPTINGAPVAPQTPVDAAVPAGS